MTNTKVFHGINIIPIFVTLHVKINFPGQCVLYSLITYHTMQLYRSLHIQKERQCTLYP